jgi:hypothetical protein
MIYLSQMDAKSADLSYTHPPTHPPTHTTHTHTHTHSWFSDKRTLTPDTMTLKISTCKSSKTLEGFRGKGKRKRW